MFKYVITFLILNFHLIAQTKESAGFFPHGVGDKWEYVDYESGAITIREITKDSLGLDSSIYLFYNNEIEPDYKVDTAGNVIWLPLNPFVNFLEYKLFADSGVIWENLNLPSMRWAWVAEVGTVFYFDSVKALKIYRYSPGYPYDSNAVYLDEKWLADGFGLIWKWREPNEITFLRGCVIDGDTFGFVTNILPPPTQTTPSYYVLRQNYPNPFNPITTLEYELPEEQYIELEIYNSIGQIITTLYKGRQTTGTYKYQWNAERYASGLYICRLRGDKQVKNIKMLYLK